MRTDVGGASIKEVIPMVTCLSPNGETSFSLDAAPTSLLIGSSAGIVRLRRESEGQPWREDGRSLVGKHIGALINAPDGRLFAGCSHRGGLFRSLDNGQTWEEVGREISASHIFSLACLDSPSGPRLLAGVEPVNLYCSDDFGDTWYERPSIAMQPGGELWTFPPPPHVPHLKAIELNPSVPDSFYACVEQGALLRTDDGGKSWIELASMWRSDDPAYRDAHRLIVAPWNPMLLIFASGVGVYRSDDGGVSWTRSEHINQRTRYPDVLVASPQDRAIFVGGPVDVPGDWPIGDPTGTIWRSQDEGRTWRPLDAGMGQSANFEALTIASYPGQYELFAGDTMGRIFSYKDGEAWQQIATTPAVSKGAHYKLADMSVKLPHWLAVVFSASVSRIGRITTKRAAARRRAEFARRKSPPTPSHRV